MPCPTPYSRLINFGLLPSSMTHIATFPSSLVFLRLSAVFLSRIFDDSSGVVVHIHEGILWATLGSGFLIKQGLKTNTQLFSEDFGCVPLSSNSPSLLRAFCCTMMDSRVHNLGCRFTIHGFLKFSSFLGDFGWTWSRAVVQWVDDSTIYETMLSTFYNTELCQCHTLTWNWQLLEWRGLMKQNLCPSLGQFQILFPCMLIRVKCCLTIHLLLIAFWGRFDWRSFDLSRMYVYLLGWTTWRVSACSFDNKVAR